MERTQKNKDKKMTFQVKGRRDRRQRKKKKRAECRNEDIIPLVEWFETV